MSQLIIPSFVNALCGLGYGYNSGIVSGLKVQIIKYTYFDNLTDESLLSVYYGLYASASLFGMVCGSSVGVWISDKFGRKKGLLLSGLLLLIIPLILSFVTNYWAVFVIRVLLGFAIGMCSCIGPLYVTETVESKYRGRIGSVYQLCITFGLALGYLANYAFAKGVYDENLKFETWQWSVQYGIGSIIGLLLLILLPFMKESEIWLNKEKNKKLTIENNNKPKSESTIQIKQEEIPLKTRISFYSKGIILGGLTQLCGINSIMFYSNSILDKVGLGNALLATFLVAGLWNFASVCIALPFFDKFKRRPLMVCSYIGLTIGNIIMGLSYSVEVPVLSVIGIVIFLFMFEGGPGCLFWIMASELFPIAIRPMGLSLSVTGSNLCNILVTFCFPILEKAIGAAPCFYIFAGVSAFGVIFIYFLIPETSGEVNQTKVIEIPSVLPENENKISTATLGLEKKITPTELDTTVGLTVEIPAETITPVVP